MAEETTVETVPVTDFSEVTGKLEELKEVLTEEKEPEKVLVDDVEMTSDEVLVEILGALQPEEKEPEKVLVNDVEMTSDEVLVEILNTLQPDPEQQEMALTNSESEIDLLQQIVTAIENQHAMILEHQEVQKELYAVNYWADISTMILICLIPLMLIVRWLAGLFRY